MFGIIDRGTKEARVFCVLNNRTKENLLPLVKNNVITDENNNEEMSEDENIQTRIYSDCFASYQTNRFRENGYF